MELVVNASAMDKHSHYELITEFPYQFFHRQGDY